MKLDEIDLLADTWEREVPHAMFDHLRQHDPVHWHDEPDGPGFWAVTRHADVVHASRDPEVFSSELGGTFIVTQDEQSLGAMRLSILNMDPPKHNHYRRLVSKGFTPRMIARLEEVILTRAARIVDDVCESGSCDFVNDIAAKLPLEMICEMIGLPESDWPAIFELSNKLVGFDDPELQTTPEDGHAAAIEIFSYCDAMAADRRARPRDDLMTALVEAEVDGERLSDLDLNLFFVTLAVAGNETTRNLISQSMLALLERPGEAQRLRDDPSLWPTATEEMLRWGTSIHSFRRTATCDTELSDTKIAEGDKVVLYYMAANRDPAVFDDPHRFDVARKPNDHVTFGGGGVHFCLGASLARSEIRAIMHEVVERLPTMEPAGPVRRLRSDFINGIKQMPVRFDAVSPRAGGSATA
jgi:cholest-4-en-3-one 26-monooxygenase